MYLLGLLLVELVFLGFGTTQTFCVFVLRLLINLWVFRRFAVKLGSLHLSVIQVSKF